MTLLDRIHNRLFVPGFLVNSLPKSGTNLLAKAVALFPGIHRSNVHIGQSTLAQLAQRRNSDTVSVPIGVDWPQLVPLHAIEQTLERLERGYYITAHIPFSEQLAALLRKMGLKTLLIVRDPRDVVVSHAKYIARTPAHFLYEEYSTLSEPEQIMRSIEGVQKSAPNAPVLLSILDRYQSVLPWISESFNYTVRFERLIGPHGGGSRDAQIEELKNIARHLKIRCSSRDIEQIAAQIFGGTHTFRKGVISDWRNHFSEEHKRVFKEIAGQLLIDLGYEQDYDW